MHHWNLSVTVIGCCLVISVIAELLVWNQGRMCCDLDQNVSHRFNFQPKYPSNNTIPHAISAVNIGITASNILEHVSYQIKLKDGLPDVFHNSQPDGLRSLQTKHEVNSPSFAFTSFSPYPSIYMGDFRELLFLKGFYSFSSH